MSGILVLGAGGHGKVVADILLTQRITVIGFLDDNPALWGSSVLGLPVLGSIDSWSKYQPGGLALGIGDNRLRLSIVQRLGNSAINLWVNAIHPKAVVSTFARIGRGTVVSAGAIINPEAVIGDYVIVNTAASVDHDCVVKNYAHLAPGSHLAGGTAVGVGVLMGVGSATIPYRSIGDWAVVGAGATVIHNIPENVTAVGTPARW